MKERILQFLKAENKSSAQFAEEIGVQPSGISHILSGRNNPSLDFVIKMLEKYRFLSVDWLLFGKGDMYRDTGMQNLFNQTTEFAQESPDTSKKTAQEVAKNRPVNNVTETGTENEKPLLERIVWFFNDGSFREYSPGK